jgi:hypothetical protein
VQEEDLSLPVQLTIDRLFDELIVVGRHVRYHASPVQRRRPQRAYVAQAEQRHVQSPRDWRCRHGENINVYAESLEPFLVLDSESLLLVDYQQPEIFEPNVAAEETMRSDQDVDPSRPGPGDYVLRLFGRLEAIQNLDADRKICEPFGESPAVLHTQNGRRRQYGNLLAVLYCLERRTHGKLGLAVADVAAEQSVHHDRLLHVGLDLPGRRGLVGRLLIGKGFLEFHLPIGIFSQRNAARHLAIRLDLEQIGGKIADGILDFLFLLEPFLRADLA